MHPLAGACRSDSNQEMQMFDKDDLMDLLLAIVMLAVCLGVAMVPVVAGVANTHNAAGGYIDACGDLPGLVGDDC